MALTTFDFDPTGQTVVDFKTWCEEQNIDPMDPAALNAYIVRDM